MSKRKRLETHLIPSRLQNRDEPRAGPHLQSHRGKGVDRDGRRPACTSSRIGASLGRLVPKEAFPTRWQVPLCQRLGPCVCRCQGRTADSLSPHPFSVCHLLLAVLWPIQASPPGAPSLELPKPLVFVPVWEIHKCGWVVSVSQRMGIPPVIQPNASEKQKPSSACNTESRKGRRPP